jgi:hypothetical protein
MSFEIPQFEKKRRLPVKQLALRSRKPDESIILNNWVLRGLDSAEMDSSRSSFPSRQHVASRQRSGQVVQSSYFALEVQNMNFEPPDPFPALPVK